MNIVVDDKIPFIQGILEPYATVRYVSGRTITRERITDADALLIRTRTACNRTLLEGSPVAFIASATIGYDHIDTVYCKKNNITWENAPGCNASSVQQYIASALFYLASKYGFKLKDKILGIIGVGYVGARVSSLAKNLGMKVLLNDPPRERMEGPAGFTSLDRILGESDIITLHVPLNMKGPDKTFRMVDRSFLNKMRKGSFLINTARGQIVDEEALKRASVSGKVAGIILDVWENEPKIDRELLNLVCIGTPHVAGYSADGKANGTSMVVQAFSRFYNLDLDDWYPHNIPAPSHPILRIDCRGTSTERITGKAILHTYSIENDHTNLRHSPGEFEELRGNYPVRREFPAYSLELTNSDNKTENVVMNLGFTIKRT